MIHLYDIFLTFASVKQNGNKMEKISKLYFCELYDILGVKTLARVDGTSIVRLRVNDFAKLCSAGFRVVVLDHYDILPSCSFYKNCFRRAVRVANYILINRKLPPKL